MKSNWNASNYSKMESDGPECIRSSQSTDKIKATSRSRYLGPVCS